MKHIQCDFCNEQLKDGEGRLFFTQLFTVEIKTRDSVKGTKETTIDHPGVWFACQSCAVLIQAGDRSSLRKRSARVQDRYLTMKLIELFWKHRSGNGG